MFGELTLQENTNDAAIVSLIAALIDESGSMHNVRDDTIGGYNSFVKTIQQEQLGKTAYCSTFLFDSDYGSPVIRILQDAVDLQQAKPLSSETYSPRGTTPLYDAIGLSINKIEQAVKDKNITKVTFLIQTDGWENASKEFSHSKVKELIEEKTKAGWQIIFLGADLSNAHQIGTSIGVQAQNSMGYAKSNTAQTFSAMASSTSAYRNFTVSSSVIHLTEAQKQDLLKNHKLSNT